MIFTPTTLDGVVAIDIERRTDARGFFARTFSLPDLAAHGLAFQVVHQSIAWNRSRGTLRGLHYQADPHGERKLVRCTRGAIWDVVLDLRPGSPTYRRWVAFDLTADNCRTIHIPRGVAHGYLTLTDDVEVHYQMDAPYEPTAARVVRWDDAAFGIEWPAAPAIMSTTDREAASWSNDEPEKPAREGPTRDLD